jgi:dCMP deaminase
MSTPVNQELPPQKHAINTPGLEPALSFFISVSPNSPPQPPEIEPEKLVFTSPAQLLLYVTRNWEDNFVTVDLTTKELIESFMKRPFFLLVSIDAPLMQRFARRNQYVCPSSVGTSTDSIIEAHPQQVLSNLPEKTTTLFLVRPLGNFKMRTDIIPPP